MITWEDIASPKLERLRCKRLPATIHLCDIGWESWKWPWLFSCWLSNKRVPVVKRWLDLLANVSELWLRCTVWPKTHYKSESVNRDSLMRALSTSTAAVFFEELFYKIPWGLSCSNHENDMATSFWSSYPLDSHHFSKGFVDHYTGTWYLNLSTHHGYVEPTVKENRFGILFAS